MITLLVTTAFENFRNNLQNFISDNLIIHQLVAWQQLRPKFGLLVEFKKMFKFAIEPQLIT